MKGVLAVLALTSCTGAYSVENPDVDAGVTELPCEDDVACARQRVQLGYFWMGCPPGVDALACEPYEQPYRTVQLDAFEIDRFEVAQREYEMCVVAGACTRPAAGVGYEPELRGQYPVTGVTWWQASRYCRYVGRELPTEAEWERAARGDDGALFPWGSTAPSCDEANFMVCTDDTNQTMGPLPVGSRAAGMSPYMVHDMAGNVAEWVADWWDPRAYESRGDDVSHVVNPRGPVNGTEKVVRGGSYESAPSALYTFRRDWHAPDDPLRHIGFRCSKQLPVQ